MSLSWPISIFIGLSLLLCIWGCMWQLCMCVRICTHSIL